MRYPVLLHKDIDSDYGVTIPDVKGCYSSGETIDKALSNAVEALHSHLEILISDGHSVPTPSTIDTYQKHEDYQGGIWKYVDIHVE